MYLLEKSIEGGLAEGRGQCGSLVRVRYILILTAVTAKVRRDLDEKIFFL
jgi:hypothetical protein